MQVRICGLFAICQITAPVRLLPEWFVLCFIYISIMLRGRRKAAFFLLCTAETLLCYYTAFRFPQFVAQNTRQHSFFDSATSVILIGFLTSVLILFITYAGMSEENLKYIQELVRQYCPFERVYLQKASPAIASNCGPG